MRVHIAGYRGDIDGLRAIAIIPVVLYHAGIPGFAGGFVGVDVFFVISGYLITGILAREIHQRKFSVLTFYERRMRRLLPALLTVVAATYIAGLAILPPASMKELGNEIVWSSFFSANVWFFQKSGYWDIASNFKPLLHLWSLAIEEQFYVIFPLLLGLLQWTRLRQHGMAAVLAAIFLLSLGVSVWAASNWPLAGFYLLPSRAWELMCGSLLAMGPRPRLSGRYREALALTGLLAITVSVLCFNERTPFPGYAALMPCLGATMLIWAGEGEKLPAGSRLLALPGMVWIGRISYPLYLWHWPLLVLARFYCAEEPSPAVRMLLIVISLALAAATTTWIEAPVRSGRILFRRLPLLLSGSAAIIIMLAAGQSASERGFPQRIPVAVREAIAEAMYHPNNATALCVGAMCDASAKMPFRNVDVFRFGRWDAEGPVDVVIWGDSHTGNLAPAVSAIAQKLGLRGIVYSFNGCPPLLGVVPSYKSYTSCNDFNAAVADLLRRSPASIVVLTARWASIVDVASTPWSRLDIPDREGAIEAPHINGAYAARSGHNAFDTGLKRTLDFLRQTGAKAILVQDNPEQPANAADAMAMAALLHRNFAGVSANREEVEAAQTWVDERFSQAEAEGSASYVRTFDVFCDRTSCPAERNGRLLYTDDNHLSTAGAMLLRPVLEPVLAGMMENGRKSTGATVTERTAGGGVLAPDEDRQHQ